MASRPLRLLLVDDHLDSAEVLASLLEMRGYQVKTAGTVGAALALALAEHFDLLVSDVGLPDATGHDLMRSLHGKGIKGIAISGWGRTEDIEASREAGFSVHLTKPVALKSLETAIAQALAS